VARPIIGLLLNSLFDGYEAHLCGGMLRAAEELDVDLVCFLGGSLGDGSRRSSLFELVRPDCVDAVVVLTPSLGNVAGPGEVAALMARMAPLPVVSVSERLPGVPNVLVDNSTGVAALMEHLVEHHGRRRVAYVGGPGHNVEAALRFQAYREALARSGIGYDPALVVEGDWAPPAGLRAVRTLLDDRRVAFDAVFGSSDLTALSAMDELRRRGVDVPGQVAVCGFDDIAEAASATPPLTTVRQPLAEMARECLRRALALARGAAAEPDHQFPATLVTRQSCGCPRVAAAPPDPALSMAPVAGAVELASRLEARFPALGVRMGIPTWAAELAAPLAGAAAPDDAAFLSALEGVLSRSLELPEPAEWFQVVRAVTAFTGGGAALSDAAHALVGTMASAAERTRRARADEETRVLHRLIQPFPLPEEAFLRNLLGGLDQLGVRSFFLSRYLDADLRTASLIVARDLDGVAAPEAGAAFPSCRLVPGRFTGIRRRAHAVLPIQSPDGPIGFAVCEMGPLRSSGYEVLMHQISTVLSMNGLVDRLREQQRQLLQTARQAGMAELAVGTLHNVGNVLTTVSVCAEQIAGAGTGPSAVDGLRRAVQLLLEHRDDLPGFFARDPRAALVPKYLERVAEELLRERARTGEEAQLLLAKVKLVRDTVAALQGLAREGNSPLLRERVDLGALAEAVLETQAPLLARLGVALETQLEGGLSLVTDRAKVVHVLVNLVKNAAEAMRDARVGGRILRLGIVAAEGDRIRITVADSGEGIPPENLERIFSYGFTTKPDGHGFGLHTCALYARELGGALVGTSPGPGRGAAFTLELPRESPAAAARPRASLLQVSPRDHRAY
jgi:DNA-binding LacI/PurR family transcriptional regulator/signal transduction histidine kinase